MASANIEDPAWNVSWDSHLSKDSFNSCWRDLHKFQSVPSFVWSKSLLCWLKI